MAYLDGVSRLGLGGGPRSPYPTFIAAEIVEVVEDVAEEVPTGGWLNDFEAYSQRKSAKEKRRKELLVAVRELDGIDGEIAVLLHKQESQAESQAANAELSALIESTITAQEIYRAGLLTERVSRAYDRAAEKATFSAVQALERELERAMEEEEFLFAAMMIQ